MTNRDPKRRLFLLLAAVMVVTALVVSVVVLSAKRQETKQQHPKDWLSSIPQVMSKVKDLEIINARIVRTGDELGVAFEIRNNSDRAVMAVNITCGEAGISKDGLQDEENPTVIIEPHGTLEAEMNDELAGDTPIVISAATFQDGKEEGIESSVKLMQKIRARERGKHKAQRETKAAERRPNS
jgi:hypothetical protein